MKIRAKLSLFMILIMIFSILLMGSATLLKSVNILSTLTDAAIVEKTQIEVNMADENTHGAKELLALVDRFKI